MKLLSLFLLVMLSACATSPFRDLAPDKKLSPTERIGVLIDVTDTPTHRHAGGNPFIADYDRPYTFDWKLTQHITDRLSEKISTSTKFQLVKLKDYGLKLDDVAGLVVPMEKEYVLNFRKDKTIARLKNELGLRTVIVFSSSGKTNMVNYCGQFSCRMSDGMHTGLYTTAGLLTFRPVSDVRANVYVLDVPTDLGDAKDVLQAQYSYRHDITKYKKPNDIKNITEQEWAPIRVGIESFIDQYIDEVVKELLLSAQP